MTVRFVDTNVLLYGISADVRERSKRDVARALLAGSDVCLSVQVLQEFYTQATRPSRPDALDQAIASGMVEAFLRFPVAVTTPSVMTAAIATSERYSLSYWDAAIIEAARSIGCDVVLSEDMGAGQDYDGVRVHNPFESAGA